MNVRVFLVVPAVLAVGILAGCGQTGGDSGSGSGSGSAHLKAPSTWVCSAPAYIRERAPEGFCDSTDQGSSSSDTVNDDLSPLRGP
ncbi:hypothetical protein EV187_2889 [Agromyces ramosus]|uniref:Uncharacterized protein n=1 Tax=Agromyces ramosus TaxID=33879 RepID=A0A4Q7MCS3_9MICO|nr:hypothetical protein [Agromyces ramosus]RZS64502.1 hypothetical protein EV187_2889 [Agromyces ramosus]